MLLPEKNPEIILLKKIRIVHACEDKALKNRLTNVKVAISRMTTFRESLLYS
jgi:hypothetical protein